MRRALVAAAMELVRVLAVASAAAAAPAAPVAGFTLQRLDDTHFRLTWRSRDVRSRAEVDAYLLYQAAEAAAVRGFGWFEMADRRRAKRGWRPSWTVSTHPGVERWDRLGGIYADDRVDYYQATAEIVVGRGPRPADDPAAYDAAAVLQAGPPRQPAS